MTPSIRMRILRALQGQFSALEVGPEVPFTFSVVALGHMPDTIGNKRAVVGIVPGTERKSDLFPEKEAILPLDVEFRFMVQASDKEKPDMGGGEPTMAAEICLLLVQRTLLIDLQLGGLCLDIRETANQIDLDAFSDRSVAGVVNVEVQYRHDERDPATRLGAPPP